jgi:hypothetical protein
VSKFVIPAKSRKAGREPGSRKNFIILNLFWIPDLARLGELVRNDGFGDFATVSRGEEILAALE